ncbi:septum site-determining protein MinD [Candidatus Woesearchaeota archaeon CG10_big_fil_rev_8_21_14_0_10_34_12]|nr:MAG: septum site-determining protein MinD [Candidatus Woesearchaeota archaeon CG10_big_fil_rev_8_21_14_0_10_34_12]
MTVFTIASGKGGVGKTITAINLGVALNSFGKEVIIIDANFTAPDLGVYLGAPIVPVSLNHVIKDKAKIDDALYEHHSGTKIVPLSLSIKDMKKLNHSKLPGVVNKLKKLADYIIIDSAAGLGSDTVSAIKSSDEIIVVTNPEMPAVTNALKTIRIADELGRSTRGIVITRVRGWETEMPMQSIKGMLERPILGIVPEERSMQRALVKKDAIFHTHPRSKAAVSYKGIAANVLGLPHVRQPDSIFSKFMKVLGMKS